MKFCDKCGSFMLIKPNGFYCEKCEYNEPIEIIEIRKGKRMTVEPVYVIGKNVTNALKVNQKCPSCSNYEAFKKVSTTQGEHAGVKHERSVEHYICTKCSYKWTKS